MPHPRSSQATLPTGCQPQALADFEVNWGMITTISILSEACRQWLDENAETELWQWFRDDLVAIEPSYAPVLVKAMLEAGLVVVED
jgi:hypothetical protein